MPFKTPDGKVFETRPEWRDYMMLTFYSFKNKVNVSEPLVKSPGDVDGQMFDIADCENSTMIIMDQTEQVQIDMLKGCRVFLGACSSAIFIRNCENCTFFVCCRQLRLRDCVNCTLYTLSMAEIHIEFTTSLKVGPFLGGYPLHAKHLSQANLDPTHNLWYDVFDHNDPGKSHANWSIISDANYESPWFPAGICEPAVPITAVGAVKRQDQELDTNSSMQSFGFEHLVADAKAIEAEKLKAQRTTTTTSIIPPLPPALPLSTETTTTATTVTAIVDSEIDKITLLLIKFANEEEYRERTGAEVGSPLSAEGEGQSSSTLISELWHLDPIQFSLSKDMGWTTLWVHTVNLGNVQEASLPSLSPSSPSDKIIHYTAIFHKDSSSGGGEEVDWKIVHFHKSPPKYLSETDIKKNV